MELKFRPDGTFKIVQFTDLHMGDDREEMRDKDERTAALIERVIAAEKPDLVVLTGDLNWSEDIADPLAAGRKAIAPVARAQVPWAAVFGNHDAEAGVTREQLLAAQREYPGCLTEAGPADIAGVGNYTLTVRRADGSAGAALIFLDSGDYAPKEPVGGYAWVQADQIAWYTRESRRMAAANGGTPLPALAFFHIPLPEYEAAWTEGAPVGTKGENVECARLNSGLFAAMAHNGDVMGTFVGHDHDNDYSGTLHGIRLSYGRVTGYNTYGRLPRGGRAIVLREGERTFDTWVVQEDGTVVG